MNISIYSMMVLVTSLLVGGEVFVVEYNDGISYDPAHEYSYKKKRMIRSISIDGNDTNITVEEIERERIVPQPIPYRFRVLDANDSNSSNESIEINSSIILMPTKVSDHDTLGEEIGYRDSNITEDDNQTIFSTRSLPVRTDISRGRTLPITGRLYFRHKGSPRACSASLVDSPDILVTAGHCLANYGVIHTDMQYFPSPDTSRVHYRAKAFFIPKKWRKNLNFAYDFGIIKLSKPVGGRTINLSSLYNPPKMANVTAYGYPGGAVLYQVPGVYKHSGSYLYMVNSLRSGSSGGPWIDRSGRVNGLNSFHYVDNPNIMYSPYFSTEFKRLLNQAKAYK